MFLTSWSSVSWPKNNNFNLLFSTSLVEMDNHSKDVHGRKRVSKYTKIKAPIVGPKEIRPFVDHLKVRKSEPTKKCKICLNKFYTVEEVKVRFVEHSRFILFRNVAVTFIFKEHINTVHEFDDQRCEICGVSCAGKIKLQEHMDLHATR